MQFIKYTSIGQFRSVCKQVKSIAEYEGYDDVNGKAIINSTKVKPTLTFNGTVKVHGTNAGVSLDIKNDELWAQSRNNIITPEKDNAGFAFFVETNKGRLRQILLNYSYMYEKDVEGIITIFGEWCGGNIQKGVGVNGLDKMFIIFGCKITDEDGGEHWVEVEDQQCFTDNLIGVYCIKGFPTYSVGIDFNQPELITDTLVDITTQVEQECPVAKGFGVSGIGEGVVWESVYNDQVLRFKVKGEKHSVSKVKKLASVDIEKIESINEFVEYAATENRFQQGVEQVFTINNLEVDIKLIGSFLSWVMSDIIKEEMDTMMSNKLEPKDVGKYVNNKARTWFMSNYM